MGSRSTGLPGWYARAVRRDSFISQIFLEYLHTAGEVLGIWNFPVNKIDKYGELMLKWGEIDTK